MLETRLGIMESRFADLVWENVPLTASELCELCDKAFEWKRTTTYTVLKRLCDKGLFSKGKKGVVTALVTREEFYAQQSDVYVSESFGGSLPAFLTAFTSKNRLSKNDIDEIKKMIETFEE